MDLVTSRDGTRIAVDIVGDSSRPPLVLVYGTTGSVARWRELIPFLEKRHRLFVIERRGRGESGDAADYSLAREVEDLVAVVDWIGAPVGVFGHSFGGVIALEAACASRSITKLALYEPALAVRGPLYPPGVLARCEEALARGENEAVVATFFSNVLGFSDEELARERNMPSWPARVRAAHTLPREVRATDAYEWAPARYARLAIPVRVFVGGASHALVQSLMNDVVAAIPRAELVVLDGQKHVAMDTNPQLLATEMDHLFS